MAATGGLFFAVRQPRTYHVRTVLFNMNECEVIERFRLSSARINWLVEKFRGELQRNTSRSCPLSVETQVSTYRIKATRCASSPFCPLVGWLPSAVFRDLFICLIKHAIRIEEQIEWCLKQVTENKSKWEIIFENNRKEDGHFHGIFPTICV